MQFIVAIGGAKQEAMFGFQSRLVGALAILHGGICVACCNNACFLPVQDCLQCQWTGKIIVRHGFSFQQ
jgi:acyl-coenzyme A thioesterase PaaI-like protein